MALKAHWAFDEGSGTAAADSSGNGFGATGINTPGWVTGKVGAYATDLASASSEEWRVDAFSATLVGTNDFTFAAWIKTSAATDTAVIAKMTLAGIGTGFVWVMGESSNSGRMFVKLGDGSTNTVYNSSAGAVNDGNWHHVAVSVDRGVFLKFYVDGVFQSDSGSSTTNTLHTAAVFPTIGHDQLFGYNSFFNGSIDDLRVYDTALTGEEIAALPGLSSGTHRMMMATNR